MVNSFGCDECVRGASVSGEVVWIAVLPACLLAGGVRSREIMGRMWVELIFLMAVPQLAVEF